MELHQLRYFVAVAECDNFRRAAVHCNVSQPSLSQQVIKLEKELGHRLFDRLGRHIALTEAGQALLPRARQILAQVREAERELAQDIESGRGTLTLGAIPTIAPFLLPRAIRRFVKDQPRAELSVVEDVTDALVAKLLNAELEICFLALPLDYDQLETEALMQDPLLVVAPRESVLARDQDVPLEALREQPAVVLHEMHCLGEQVQAFCHGQGVQQRIVCRSTQLSTVQSLVGLGMGVSIVPRICAAQDASSQRVYRPLRGASPSRTIAVAWHGGRPRSRLAEHFIERVREEGQRLSALDDSRICR